VFNFVQDHGQFYDFVELESCQACRRGEGHGRPSRRGNFNRPSTICRTCGPGRNAYGVS